MTLYFPGETGNRGIADSWNPGNIRDGTFTNVFTLVGTVSPGDVITLQLASTRIVANINQSPVTITYTVNGGDTLATVGAALANLVNGNPVLRTGAGIWASSVGAAVLVRYNALLNIVFTASIVSAGATLNPTDPDVWFAYDFYNAQTGDTITVTIGTTVVTYTVLNTDTPTTVAATFNTLINAATGTTTTTLYGTVILAHSPINVAVVPLPPPVNSYHLLDPARVTAFEFVDTFYPGVQIAVSPDNLYLYVAAQDVGTGGGAVFKVRISDFSIVAEHDYSLDVHPLNSNGWLVCPMFVSPDGSKLFVTGTFAGQTWISGLNTSDLSLINTVQAAGANSPRQCAIAMSPDGSKLAFITGNAPTATLRLFDTTAFTFSNVTITNYTAFITSGNPVAWVDNSNVAVIDTTGNVGASYFTSIVPIATGVISSSTLLAVPATFTAASDGSAGSMAYSGGQYLLVYSNFSGGTAQIIGAFPNDNALGGSRKDFPSFNPIVMLPADTIGGAHMQGFILDPYEGGANPQNGVIYTCNVPPTVINTMVPDFSGILAGYHVAPSLAVAASGSFVYAAAVGTPATPVNVVIAKLKGLY